METTGGSTRRYPLYDEILAKSNKKETYTWQSASHAMPWRKKRSKTYNSGDSLVVTHLTTNPPVHCLYMAERTGSLIFSVLWSYVEETENGTNIMLQPSSLYLDLQFKNYHHTSHNKVRP